MNTFTPTDTASLSKFEAGDMVVFVGHVRWYRRLWRWLTRWKPTVLTVVAVDHENGCITVDGDASNRQS